MLRLSDVLSGLVCGNHLGKIYGKISAENRKRNPFPLKLWGGAF